MRFQDHVGSVTWIREGGGGGKKGYKELNGKKKRKKGYQKAKANEE